MIRTKMQIVIVVIVIVFEGMLEANRKIQRPKTRNAIQKDEEWMKERSYESRAQINSVKRSNTNTPPSSVAFTYKIYDDTDEIAVGDTVKFDTQMFDNTGSFDPSTGEFTAPSCGMYVFMLNIRSNQGKVCWIDIIKDGGERLATAFAQSSDKVHDGDSTFLTIYLKEGDKVWTKNHGYQGTVCTIDFDSSFAGFRLN
ncbi:complement C1q-like protein 2 [Mytilus edulis]|uniref:complement C1q-like protein 2 n=1 Tax=Mytilus edulis TaxID=6550 RepID=UPI0039F149D7